MAFRHISAKEIKDRSKQNKFGSLSDNLLDLKVTKDNPVNEKTIRICGWPLPFIEFSNKVRNPDFDKTKDKGPDNKEFNEVPFPDADLNKNPFTRVGNPDQDQCPWKKLGYTFSNQYAVNVLQRPNPKDKDGVSIPKILKKGSSIFGELSKWELGRHAENVSDSLEGDDLLPTFLGGKVARDVTITATRNTQKLGNVEYTVNVKSKKSVLTPEEIELLRAIHEPKPEELTEYRNDYLADKKKFDKMREEDEEFAAENPPMPEWQDFWTYGFNIDRIYKYVGIKTAEKETNSSEMNITPESGSEDEKTETAVEPASTTKKEKKEKTEKVTSEADAPATSPFVEAAEEDESEDIWG